MASKYKRAAVIAMPAVVPYYGPRPSWLTSGRPMFITTTEGVYRSRDGITVKIPAGYITDFASNPRFLWSILPPHGGLMLASLPHDWGYSHGGKSGLLPKHWWDALFHDLLVITPDVAAWKVPVAYAGVRAGGKGGWKNGWHSFVPGTVPAWEQLGGEA